MVDPNSRLAGFLQPVRGYATGDEVIRPKITVEFGEHEEPTSTTNVGMLKTMEPMQSWIEENIGEDKEVLGSRTLHTLGKEKLLGFFVGQVMKESKGKANPEQVNKLLNRKLKK